MQQPPSTIDNSEFCLVYVVHMKKERKSLV